MWGSTYKLRFSNCYQKMLAIIISYIWEFLSIWEWSQLKTKVDTSKFSYLFLIFTRMFSEWFLPEADTPGFHAHSWCLFCNTLKEHQRIPTFLTVSKNSDCSLQWWSMRKYIWALILDPEIILHRSNYSLQYTWRYSQIFQQEVGFNCM